MASLEGQKWVKGDGNGSRCWMVVRRRSNGSVRTPAAAVFRGLARQPTANAIMCYRSMLAHPFSERVMGVGGIRRAVLFGFLPLGHTLVAGHGQSTPQSNLRSRKVKKGGELGSRRLAARSRCLRPQIMAIGIAIRMRQTPAALAADALPTHASEACKALHERHPRLISSNMPSTQPRSLTRGCRMCWSRRRC